MEVHHQPHVDSDSHRKKNFKEYFSEFIMIFLAVTLGFFAESLREYVSEHKHAKEYAKSMISDLTSDSTDLEAYIAYYTIALNNIDTLSQLLSNEEVKQISTGKLYWYGLWGGATGSFVPHDATIHQMESSGTLRYFTNPTLNRNVANYDQLCRKWQKSAEADLGIYTEVRKARARIFEFKYNEIANNIYQASKIDSNRALLDSFMKTNPPLLTEDKTLFNEYLEMIRSRFIEWKLKDAKTLLHQAILLIDELEKDYHLSEGEKMEQKVSK
ncbi:MAG TPA: hypothetical protein VMU83_12000 [Hanamia sp.]|nr:hypothetical protein [Hanamia sp.]